MKKEKYSKTRKIGRQTLSGTALGTMDIYQMCLCTTVIEGAQKILYKTDWGGELLLAMFGKVLEECKGRGKYFSHREVL